MMNLRCLMSYWSSASWCPAAPLLPDVLLILCCLVSCSVLLPDVLQIHCCIMSCCFSADWCPADPLLHDILLLLRWLVPCRFTAAWCPAASLLTGVLQIRPTAPLLTGVLQIHCCMMSTTPHAPLLTGVLQINCYMTSNATLPVFCSFSPWKLLLSPHGIVASILILYPNNLFLPANQCMINFCCLLMNSCK